MLYVFCGDMPTSMHTFVVAFASSIQMSACVWHILVNQCDFLHVLGVSQIERVRTHGIDNTLEDVGQETYKI